jgi:hypothetical protein
MVRAAGAISEREKTSLSRAELARRSHELDLLSKYPRSAEGVQQLLPDRFSKYVLELLERIYMLHNSTEDMLFLMLVNPDMTMLQVKHLAHLPANQKGIADCRQRVRNARARVRAGRAKDEDTKLVQAYLQRKAIVRSGRAYCYNVLITAAVERWTFYRNCQDADALAAPLPSAPPTPLPSRGDDSMDTDYADARAPSTLVDE